MGVINLIFLLFLPVLVHAQWGPSYEAIKIHVYPDHADWTYKVGEPVTFLVAAYHYGSPAQNKEVSFEVGPEKMEAREIGTIRLENGKGKISVEGLSAPGFLRCRVFLTMNDKKYTGLATAAFDPDQIRPTTDEPTDFLTFWEEAKAALAEIPMQPKMERVDRLSDDQIDVYHVQLQNFRPGSHLYGVLNVPRNSEKMGAILKVPGAGVWPAFMAQDPDAKQGLITFEIRIHGIPMISEDDRIYQDLWSSAAHNYWNNNLDDKNHYYYKRVYLGCVRAIDYIFSLEQFDGLNLGVSGGSQGGALSIITASLDDRVKYLVSYYPALCDLTGYLHGRAGGWPHLFNEANKSLNAKPDKIETSRYYDVVNFARHLTMPGYYAWGFNDEVCPPTSMHAAYNVISAEKHLNIAPVAGHHDFPEQKVITTNWLINKLKGQ